MLCLLDYWFYQELVDNSQDKHKDNAQPSDDSIDAVVEEAHLPPSSSPTKNTDDR